MFNKERIYVSSASHCLSLGQMKRSALEHQQLQMKINFSLLLHSLFLPEQAFLQKPETPRIRNIQTFWLPFYGKVGKKASNPSDNVHLVKSQFSTDTLIFFRSATRPSSP